MLRNREEAEDASQEVFLRAVRAIGTFRGEASLNTWLHQIARNACVTRLAATKKSLEDAADRSWIADLASDEPGADRSSASVELREALELAIGELEPAFREVILLREIENQSYEDIAQITETSVATVKTRIYRAREKLKIRSGGVSLMRCEDLHIELSAWIDGELSAGDRTRIAAHLQTCPACSDHVRSLQDTSSKVRALPAPRAPASVTQTAMRQVSAMKRQAAAPSPRWRLSLAWPIPALGVGLVGLGAAIALAVFVERPDGAKIPSETAASLHSGASSAANPMPNGADYRLSSAPDSVTGSIAITRGYDFRGAQSHRDISMFNARERYAWDHGTWRHERRFGREGWWWDVEGAWYWYDTPAAGPPAIVSDIRFAAESGAAGSMTQPPPTSAGPPQPR